ncbi:NAD-dependent protein lipoamidase sirtuin-4 [Podila minutissima]|nr:NAD-dependent protein lipoamidase sirtuin-4 [Podila minutissima]
MRLRISLRSVAKTISTSTSTSPSQPLAISAKILADFIDTHSGSLAALTGAGVSTDSAIPDYRGQHGTYTLNPDYQPIFYQAFRDSDQARHRYWARSFLGFPPILTTQPNPTHFALAALQGDQDNIHSTRHLSSLITQNVDGLHQKAGARDVIELHGSLHLVRCMKCGHEEDRGVFQETLAELNPDWQELLVSQSASKLYTRMNADGDVDLKTPEEQRREEEQHADRDVRKRAPLDYHTFQYPTCSCCGTGQYKPKVVFFGENIPQQTKDASTQAVLESSGLLVMGTSLATYSAFRLVKLAKETGIPIAMVNIGPSRADELADVRVDGNSSLLMKEVARELGIGEVKGEIRTRIRVMNVVGS